MYYSLTALWASIARRQARRVPEGTDTAAYYNRMANHRLGILKAREGAFYHPNADHEDAKKRIFIELLHAANEAASELRRTGYRRF